LRQVSVAGPVIAAVAGCGPDLSSVACSDVTFPRRGLCALAVCAIVNAATASKAACEMLHCVFIEHLLLGVDCTLGPQQQDVFSQGVGAELSCGCESLCANW
jgi:hypothetical protein